MLAMLHKCPKTKSDTPKTLGPRSFPLGPTSKGAAQGVLQHCLSARPPACRVPSVPQAALLSCTTWMPRSLLFILGMIPRGTSPSALLCVGFMRLSPPALPPYPPNAPSHRRAVIRVASWPASTTPPSPVAARLFWLIHTGISSQSGGCLTWLSGCFLTPLTLGLSPFRPSQAAGMTTEYSSGGRPQVRMAIRPSAAPVPSPPPPPCPPQLWRLQPHGP